MIFHSKYLEHFGTQRFLGQDLDSLMTLELEFFRTLMISMSKIKSSSDFCVEFFKNLVISLSKTNKSSVLSNIEILSFNVNLVVLVSY